MIPMIRAILKLVVSPILQKANEIYFSHPRKYTYNGISVWVEPTVFPPLLTISTKLLLQFIDARNIQGKTFLELGCGCGIISILAAKKGATVTASDINEIAIAALNSNAADNGVKIFVVESDLFENLQGRSFDWIVINPPYYPKKPTSVAEQAWFCGENFEYFEKLFIALPDFSNPANEIYMILSEDCNLEKIKAIALTNNMKFTLVSEKKVAAEKNYIFKLENL